MRQAPKETVDSWLRQRSLDPLRLVPALLSLHRVPRDLVSPNQAIRYLSNVIFEQGNTSPTIHNLMVTFYATSSGSDDGPLMRFLSTAPSDPLTSKPYYDLDYALRLCKETKRMQPCVHIYAKMGLWESSVDLALEKGDLDLAQANADMPPEEDRQLRKRLWLKIAKYVVQTKQDIKMCVQCHCDIVRVLTCGCTGPCASWRTLTYSRSKTFCHSSLTSSSLTISRRRSATRSKATRLTSISSRARWTRRHATPRPSSRTLPVCGSGSSQSMPERSAQFAHNLC